MKCRRVVLKDGVGALKDLQYVVCLLLLLILRRAVSLFYQLPDLYITVPSPFRNT
jgi:hypothetical protein